MDYLAFNSRRRRHSVIVGYWLFEPTTEPSSLPVALSGSLLALVVDISEQGRIWLPNHGVVVISGHTVAEALATRSCPICDHRHWLGHVPIDVACSGWGRETID